MARRHFGAARSTHLLRRKGGFAAASSRSHAAGWWPWLVPLVLAGVPALPTGAAGAGEVPVTPSIQVTKTINPARGHAQPQVMVHPEDPNILAIYEAEFLTNTCALHVSRDRGRTWRKAPGRPVPPQYKACARPTFGPFHAARFGIDGTIHVVAAGSESAGGQGPTDAYLARTSDLGQTWQFSVIARSQEIEWTSRGGTKARDMERFEYIRMAVHPTDPKRIYAGMRYKAAFLPASGVPPDEVVPTRSLVSASTDGGETWSKPVDVFESSFPPTDVLGSDVPAMSIAPDGTIYAFTKERPPPAAPASAPSPAPAPTAPAPAAAPSPTLPPGPATACQPMVNNASPDARRTGPNPGDPSPAPSPGSLGAGARLLMSKSTDGGRTWTGSVVDGSGVICIPCLTTPETALDPKTGAVYVIFEQSDTPPPNARDDRSIWFMRSTDGGTTWSKRVKLNDDDDPDRNPNYDQFFPGVSLAPDGRIDVAWYDFRTDALYNPTGTGKTNRSNETCWDVFYTFSDDGGETWATNVRISDRTMNQNEGYVLNLAYDLRGPMGIASTDETAHIAWPDSRSGRVDLPAEDIYLATVFHDPEKLVAREPNRVVPLVLGSALGLLLAGVIAFLLSMSLRRRGAQGQE